MELQALLDKLYSLHRFGIKPGLERTVQLLEAIGNPHKELRCIHVAGTNGKGSISSMSASILQESGLRVGLYTSPHIQRFNERIQVNGIQISDSDLVACFQQLEKAADELQATFFELTTAIAFLYFKQMQTDVCVIECGMGGRFDSTNVVQALVSVISSIDLDHQEYLGSTLETICFEKCGIIKSGVPVVVGEQRDALRAQISSYAKEHQAAFVLASDFVHVLNSQIDDELCTVFDLKSQSYDCKGLRVPLCGSHQVRNIECVVSTLEMLPTDLRPNETALHRGFAQLKKNTSLKARIELYAKNPVVIADVGHNPACMRELVQTLAQSPYKERKWQIVFGVMEDKEVREMLHILQPFCAQLFAVHPHIARALDSEALAEIARDVGMVTSVMGEDIAAAVHAAAMQGDSVLVCGSFYVMEAAMSTLSTLAIARDAAI